MKGRTHDEPLVHFNGFMRRGGDGVLVDILERRCIEILCEGRRYYFRSETLRSK